MKKTKSIEKNEKSSEAIVILPRGSILIMGAGIMMIISLIFVLIIISYALSFFLEKNTVTLIIIGLIPPLAISVTVPGFMITRGKDQWQRVVEIENLIIRIILSIGLLVCLVLGDISTAIIVSIGLILTFVTTWCYRTESYHSGVQYYRDLWAVYREKKKRGAKVVSSISYRR